MTERLYKDNVEISILDDDNDEYKNHTAIDYDCKTTTIRHRCDSTFRGVVTE